MNETILKLDRSGDLLRLFKQGFISWTVLRDKDIFITYLNHRHRGLIKTHAVKATADQFEVGDNLVWVAIRKMGGS
jgi:hypothetical protein